VPMPAAAAQPAVGDLSGDGATDMMDSLIHYNYTIGDLTMTDL